MTTLNIQTIQNYINMSHNNSLISNNTIYHIYSDGEITSQKGGIDYLQRSEFTNKLSIPNGNSLELIFPNQGYKNTYAIVCLKDALNIRNMMVKYINN
jgi:hypothetical protein